MDTDLSWHESPIILESETRFDWSKVHSFIAMSIIEELVNFAPYFKSLIFKLLALIYVVYISLSMSLSESAQPLDADSDRLT